MLRGSIVLLVAAAIAVAAKKSTSEPILELTDSTLEDALAKHPLMLISVTVPNCEVCEQVNRRLKGVQAELRVKAKSGVALGTLMITQQNSPVVAKIVQGQLTLPKLIIFREGEAMDYTGGFEKASIVETMLREASRDTVLTLKSVKQAERFFHLDSWSTQHTDEDKPPRVVGFFPSNNTAGYEVFRNAARKLQGLITFGECFDSQIQRKFLGQPAKKTVIQLVKADKKERKLNYVGPLAPPALAQWIATHHGPLVQDLSTESSIEAQMAIGVPLFLLLMPDSYEEDLGEMMPHFRAVATRVRHRLLFGYGFKDTEPWPQFAQQLGIDRTATGCFWMIVGNGDITGRDWNMAWLRPPSLGFQIHSMEARGKETAKAVTEEKVQSFVDDFLAQVDAAVGPPEVYEGVVEEEVADEDPIQTDGAATDGSKGNAREAAAAAAREYEKSLRKLLGNLQMNFNSGVANIKKVLDDLQDTPSLLPGKVPTLTSTLTNMDLKLKKDMLQLKRELMEVGKRKDEL